MPSTSLLCRICLDAYEEPTVSTGCWHACCRECWLRCLGSTKLCPICKRITEAVDLRRIYLWCSIYQTFCSWAQVFVGRYIDMHPRSESSTFGIWSASRGISRTLMRQFRAHANGLNLYHVAHTRRTQDLEHHVFRKRARFKEFFLTCWILYLFHNCFIRDWRPFLTDFCSSAIVGLFSK